jgi:hypothetical protein
MNRLINRLVFFIGWILSPFTVWNDAIVNIPAAYLLANLAIRFVHLDFGLLVIVFYWATNILGIALMYTAGKGILTEKAPKLRANLITILLYTAILLILDKLSLLNPIR